jgi:hypothetical protein
MAMRALPKVRLIQRFPLRRSTRPRDVYAEPAWGFGVSNRQWEGRELSKDHQMLLLTGDLTIKSSMQTKRLIEEAFAGATIDQSMLSVDIADEHAADLTLAQLLLSAKNTADREKIVFRLAHPAVGSLLTVLERGGLIGAGCPDNDFWLHEGIA